jgi:hypothetical protein
MQSLIVLFNLKAGVDAATYEQWARSVDLPSVRGLKSIAEFEVYKSASVLGNDAKPPYQYIEVLKVRDVGELFSEIQAPTMQQVAAAFQQFAEHPCFILGAAL